MIQFISHNSTLARILAVALILLLNVFAAAPSFAQDPEPPPPPPPDPITQIFQYVIQFPTDSLVEALTQAIQAILTRSIQPLEQVFSASLAKWVTSSPGIITPGGGIVDGADVMTPVWNLTSRIAILLWPLTLALTAVIAAKDVVAARSWGIGDLKQALGTWLIAVLLSATSLYWMDLANRFANATTSAILNLSFTGAAGFDPNLLTTVLIGSAVIVLGMTGLGIIVAIIILIVGISILASLILQFLARFALLYVLVALAPIVIILGVIPPLRWFTYTWLRGFVMVLAIGPVNALLLKLVMVLGVRGISNDPITAFVNFMAAAGVLSALLAINYTLIRFVFGAMGEVVQRAVGTVTAVGTLALAAVGGVAAAGAMGAAGSAGGAAGAGGGAPLAGGGGGLGAALRNPRALGAGLETAGSAMARSGGLGRGFGAALWGVGNALRQSSGNGASPNSVASQGASQGVTNQQPNASPAAQTSVNQSRQGTPAQGTTNPSTRPNTAANTSSPISGQAPQGSSSSLYAAGTTPLSGSPDEGAQSQQGATLTSTPIFQGVASNDPNASTGDSSTTTTATASRAQANVATPAANARTTAAPSRRTDATPPVNVGALNIPPPPSIAHEASRTLSVPRTAAIAPEARSLISVLDSPLDERVQNLAETYSANPTQQTLAAQGAVAALSALESHHNLEPHDLAASWDQTMGPVMIAAREGLPLQTMANDAGFRGDVTQFIGARVESGLLAAHPSPKEPLFPRVQAPSTIPWHPQLSPHDVEVGQQVATLLAAPPQESQQFAHIYHALRSPENGGGWNAGMGFRDAAREVTDLEPERRLGALDSRMNAMERQGEVSSNALRPWRVHLSRKQTKKD